MSTLSVNNILPISGNSVVVSGSLTVTGNITGTVSGSITNAATASYVTASNVVGTVTNATTASYATSASYAITAQTLLGSVTSASYAATAQTLLGSVTSASYAATSSYYDGVSIDAEIYLSPSNTSTDFPILFSSITSNLGGYGYPSYDQQPTTFTYNPSTNTFKLVGLTIIASSLPTSEPATSGQLWLSGSAGSNSKILCVRN
jgi:hypothetical protein